MGDEILDELYPAPPEEPEIDPEVKAAIEAHDAEERAFAKGHLDLLPKNIEWDDFKEAAEILLAGATRADWMRRCDKFRCDMYEVYDGRKICFYSRAQKDGVGTVSYNDMGRFSPELAFELPGAEALPGGKNSSKLESIRRKIGQ